MCKTDRRESSPALLVLYEGTPGGKLHVGGDFVVTADRRRQPVSESWSGDLPSPEWLNFRDAGEKRAPFLVKHQDNDANDRLRQMKGNMTAWEAFV